MSNSYVRSFHETLKNRFQKTDARIPMSEWICDNTTLRGRRFSFKGYEFQRKIVDDMHPDLYCRKISQVGLTETQMRKFLGMLKRSTGISGIFTLPDEKMYERVAVRVKVILDNDEIFNEGSAKPVRRKNLVQVDQSFGYFTGMTEGDATSIPADFLFHDELDLSDQAMIGLFQSRLQNSDLKMTQSFSTPKFTGFGIDKGWQNSDQFNYLVRCTSCNHYNNPEFNLNFLNLPGLTTDVSNLVELSDDEIQKINFKEAAVVCEKCRSPLELGNPDVREWVPKYPGRLMRGYGITPFVTDRLGISYIFKQLIKMRDLDQLGGFINTVLGLPSDDENARLTEAMLDPRFKSPADQEFRDNVFVGIDMGLMCHVVVGQPGYVHKFETVPVGEIVDYAKRLNETYNIVRGCVDRHPYTPTADAIRDVTEGKIYPAEYRGASTINIKRDEFEEIDHIQCNRTQAIDSVVADVRKARIDFNGYGNQKRLIIDHMRDMVRIEEPEKPATWEKVTGKDHYLHAAAFFKLAMKVEGVINFKDDEDKRTEVELFGLNNFNGNTQDLTIKSRMKSPMSVFEY